MRYTKIIENKNVKLSKHDKKQIKKILSCKQEGIYNNSGRTCYYMLKDPIEHDNIVYRSVKIKGCGYKNIETSIYRKVGNEEFVRKEPHIGFNHDKSIKFVYSQNAPLGGITLKRAKQEYNNFKLLYNAGVSTLLPYEVVLYKNKRCNKQKIGASIALCEDEYGFRLNKLLYENKYINANEMEYYNLVLYNEGILGNIYDISTRLKLCYIIAKKYAKEIKKFSKSGLYIHSGGWSNVQYSLSKKNIVLIDLDSSRRIDTNDIELIKLYSIRDFISNIYRLLISLYNPKVIHQINKQILTDNNLVFALLEGYFDSIDRKILFEKSNNILKLYFDTCFDKIKSIEDVMDNILEEDKKNYELNMAEFYKYCLELLTPLIDKADM